MLTGIQRSARLSSCGTYRWTLTRRWDSRPVLLVVMFNPSEADAEVDDPTITLTCQIAAHNGYGGIVVVNLIPLRSPLPAVAVTMTRWDQNGPDWHARDRLQDNLAVIQQEAAKAGAVLLACGALADRCPDWFYQVLEEIECGLPDGAQVFCLGLTSGGYPKHPLARGKHKVPKDAPLIPWSNAHGVRKWPFKADAMHPGMCGPEETPPTGVIASQECQACNGYGRVNDGCGGRSPYGPKCPTCGGSGRVPADIGGTDVR